MEERFNLVRKILRSPIFNSQSLEKQQVILDQIITTGEVSKQELLQIIQQELDLQNKNLNAEDLREVSYLENLPYNVLINLVTTGNLIGKDLIRLCNSSPVINEKCNRSFIVEDTGMVIPQYMFYLLLQKMEIKVVPGEDYRKIYIWVTTTKNGYAFYKLDQRLKELSILDRIVETHNRKLGYGLYPTNLLSLLYLGGEYKEISSIGLLSGIRDIFARSLDLDELRKITRITENILRILTYITYSSKFENKKEELERSELDPVKFSKILGISVLELLMSDKNFNEYFKPEIEKNELAKVKKIAINFSDNYIKTHLHWVSSALGQLSIPTIIEQYAFTVDCLLVDLQINIENDRDTDFEMSLKDPNNLDYHREKLLQRMKLQNPKYAAEIEGRLESLKNLSQDEVELLLSLHDAIYNRTISLTAKFRAGELMKLYGGFLE